MVQESAFGAFCHGGDRDCPVNHSNMFNRWEKPIFGHLFVILNAAPVPPAASAVGVRIPQLTPATVQVKTQPSPTALHPFLQPASLSGPAPRSKTSGNYHHDDDDDRRSRDFEPGTFGQPLTGEEISAVKISTVTRQESRARRGLR